MVVMENENAAEYYCNTNKFLYKVNYSAAKKNLRVPLKIMYIEPYEEIKEINYQEDHSTTL